MSTVERMEMWALRHNIGDTSALPMLFRHVAASRGRSVEDTIEYVIGDQNVSDFLAEVAQHLPKYRR
jgi:hypothetical protein